ASTHRHPLLPYTPLFRSLSTAQAHEPLPVASGEIDATPALIKLAEEAERQPLEKTTSPATTIAEPGSIGLLVLAGLMGGAVAMRSEEHTSELQSREKLVC